MVPTPGLAAYSAGMAEWSPDGSRAAWVAPDGRLALRLWTARRSCAGREIRAIQWSPDNRRVIAQSRAGQSGWVIDTRDGTTTATRASWPAIVSSAGDVAWVEIDGGTFTGTTLLSKEGGSGSRVLGSSAVPPEEYFPTLTFSPDSDWLASDTIAVPSAVTIVDMPSGAQFAPSCAACLPARGFDPVWSPDGSSLAWSQDGHVVLARTGDWAGSIVADGVPVACARRTDCRSRTRAW